MQRTQKDVQSLWQEYTRTRDPALRNELIEIYLPIVKYNADRIRAKLPDEVDIDDLMSAGIFGLMDAIESFDLSRGVKFETYCAPRIRGAILDELRTMDWVPRLVRSRAHQLEKVTAELESQLGHAPSDEQVAEHLGLSREEFHKLLRDATAVSFISLSHTHFESDSSREVREIDVLEDKRSIDPLTEAQKKDLKEVITRGLTRAERLILMLYYFEEMTMKEIGAALDLSESRVSQMHSSILNRLRRYLDRAHRHP